MAPISFDDLVAAVHAAAPSDDVLARLEAATIVSSALADSADALLTHFVDHCRASGHSWSEIGNALGVSKQAAQQRFVDSSLDRLTARTRHVFDTARQIAHDQGAAALRLDHLAVALFGEPQAIGTKVLTDLGVSQATLEEAFSARSRARGAKLSDEPPADQTIMATALELGHNYIGTEHIVLACFRHPTSLIAKAMKDAGAPESAVRPAVLAKLSAISR